MKKIGFDEFETYLEEYAREQEKALQEDLDGISWLYDLNIDIEDPVSATAEDQE